MGSMSFVRLGVAGVVAIATVAAGSVSAFGKGEEPPPFQVFVGKKAGADPSSGIGVNIDPGKKKVIYYWIDSNEAGKINVTFSDGSTTIPPGYRVRWFKGLNGKEVTDAVQGPGRPVNVRPDKRAYFRAQVKNKSASEGFCLNGEASDREFFDAATAGINNGGLCFF